MIPYFEITSYSLGPFTFQAWGTLVALGALASLLVALFFAKRNQLKSELLYDAFFWVLLAGIIGGRFGHVFFYEWEYYRQNLQEILKLWEGGMSSFGGFIAGSLSLFLFLKIKKVDLLKYLDAIAFSLPIGLMIGRMGCFFIHDHPGVETNFFLGVHYADGLRHDLGLYLSINAFFLFLLMLYFFFKKAKSYWKGFYFSLFLIYYGITRFLLDFLRIWEGQSADLRYFGLTFAQYGCLVFIGLGLYTIWKWKER